MTRNVFVEHPDEQFANIGVGFLGLGGSGGFAGADGPDRFVGDDRFRICSALKPARLPRTWVSSTFSVWPAFPLAQGLANANNRLERGGVGGVRFFGDRARCFPSGTGAARNGPE